MPSVREIAVRHSTRVLVELLRRPADGHWPEPEEIGADGVAPGERRLRLPVPQVCAQMHLA
jgi:hypothetical protein